MRLRTDIDGMTSQQLMAIVVFRLVDYSLSYDAWGQQSVTVNTIGLRRGYMGHEMLPEFGIINMNGRLYDPVLGRFFSPDPFVQMPGSPQGFNRYSYCLNNPLKYTDPSGQLFGIDDIAIIFAGFNLASSMIQGAANGGNVWKAGALSILSSAATYGVGEIFKAIGNFGHELLRAGTHGAASGVLSMLNGGNFGGGFLSGAVSSAIGSMPSKNTKSTIAKLLAGSAGGGLVALATGDGFVKGALQGLKIGFLNHYVHDTREHTELTQDAAGNLYGELAEFVVEGTRPLINADDVLSAASAANGVLDAMGNSLKRGGQNSTVGSNGKFYIHPNGERAFNGNQYVKTIKLTAFGNGISKIASPAGLIIDGISLNFAYLQDRQDLSIYGKTDYYNVAKAFSELLCSTTLGYVGLAGGAYVGSAAGPIGSIGAGFVLCIGGLIIGEKLGGQFVDSYYQTNNLFIPPK